MPGDHRVRDGGLVPVGEKMELYLGDSRDIVGATVLDAKGMAEILTTQVPIFAGFKNLMKGSRPANKTILTLIPENLVQPAVKAIEQVVGSLEEPGNGLVFILNVDQIFGISKTTRFDSIEIVS